MSITPEAARELFAKFDTDNNGRISKEELIAALSSANINHKLEQVHSYFAAADKNHDGLIDLDEFLHFISMNQSILASASGIGELTGKGVSQLKKVSETKLLDLGDQRQLSLKVSSEEPSSGETRVKLFAATGTQKSAEITKLLGTQLDGKINFALKFHATGAALAEKLPGIWAEAVEFLSELGPEAKEVFESLDVAFVQAAEGPIMTFAAKPESFIGGVLGRIASSTENILSINSETCFDFSSSIDLSAFKTLTFRDLSKAPTTVEFTAAATNFCNILALPQLSALANSPEIQNLTGVFQFFLQLASITKATGNFVVDQKLAVQMAAETGVQGLDDAAFACFLEQAEALWKENPAKELLESMEFFKNLINELKAANMEALTFYLYIPGHESALHFKLNLGDFIQHFYPTN